MKWEYKGRALARPDIIVRRLVALPLLRFSQVLVCLFLFLGWGIDVAKRQWDDFE